MAVIQRVAKPRVLGLLNPTMLPLRYMAALFYSEPNLSRFLELRTPWIQPGFGDPSVFSLLNRVPCISISLAGVCFPPTSKELMMQDCQIGDPPAQVIMYGASWDPPCSFPINCLRSVSQTSRLDQSLLDQVDLLWDLESLRILATANAGVLVLLLSKNARWKEKNSSLMLLWEMLT